MERIVFKFEGIKLGKIRKKDWFTLTPEHFSKILQAVDSYAKVTKKNEAADRVRIFRIKTFSFRPRWLS